MEEKIIIKSDSKAYVKTLLKITIGLLCATAICFLSAVAANDYGLELLSYLFAALTVITFIVFLVDRKASITVTNKRVYGNVAFGKQVDLPLDSISAVASNLFRGITVATSSGKIHFIGVGNKAELLKEINSLLIARQDKGKIIVETVKPERSGKATELKELKDLLDSGVITQEEFDAKKKQILGL